MTGRALDRYAVNPDYVFKPDNGDLDHLPGTFGKPIIGDTFTMLEDPQGLYAGYFKKYGDVFKFNSTFQKMIVLLGPEYTKLLTLDPEQIFSPRMGYNGPLGDYFAGGLLMQDFGEHKIHRRIMQSAFKTTAMRHYVADMQPIIDTTVIPWGDTENFKFYPHIKTLLLDLGAKVFLGLEMGGSETERLNNAFLDMMAGTLSLIRKDWPGLLYRKGMNGRRELEQFFNAIVPERRAVEGRDMASYFAKETDEQGELFPDQVVSDHLIFLLLAAHDTTTSALTMCMSFLAHHQDWQDKLREEYASIGGAVTYDDLGDKLPLTELVFKEVLRLHPPVPQFMRRTIRETEINGHRIPANAMVQVSPLSVQRMPEYWTDPDNFDPMRFAEGREEHKQHPFLWAPFGGGAHKCIGIHFANMLFKCVLADILPRYRFSHPPGHTYPSPVQHFPFAKPKDDLPLVLEAL